MNKTDLLTMLEYQIWANGRVLSRCARLTPEALTAPRDLSHGSLFGTLVHMLDTQWAWRIACETGQLPVDKITQARFANLADLRRYWKEDDHLLLEYIRGLPAGALNQSVTFSWPRARPRQRILWHILEHIAIHGIQHRSEMGLPLAALGRSPGDLDFLIYVSRRQGEAMPGDEE